MPEGRTWGATSAVGVDKDGKSIWVGERCGANTCLDSKLDPILKFDASRHAGEELRRGDDDLPARHARRQGRQHLDDRRTGQPAAARARRAAGFTPAAGAGDDHRAPGVQVQPRRQAADDARQGRRRARRRVLLSAQRRARRARTAASSCPRATRRRKAPPRAC